MTLLRLMRADWLKTRRTPVRWAVIVMPAGYALLILWYFSRFRVTPELPLRIYSAFFEGWGVFLPLAAGLLAGLLSLQEEQAGRFGALLGSTVPRSALYAAKLLLLIAITAGSVLMSLAILVPGMQAGLGIEAAQAGMFWEGAWLAVAGALPQMALHLWLSLACGLGASVGVGGAGLLMAAIIGATNVGDPIWPAVPWAWPVRLALHPLVPVAPADGLLPACLAFAVLAVLGTAWFCRWEGPGRDS